MSKETVNTTTEQPTRNTNHSGSTPLTGSSIDDLESRLKDIAGVNEDWATFLAHNWQRFFGALCVVLVAVVLYYQYNSTQFIRMGEAATRFDDVSKQLGKVLEPPAEIKPEDREKDFVTLFEQVRALESAQRGNIYGSLAGLYAAEGYYAKGDFPKAEAELQKYQWKKFLEATTAKKSLEVTEVSLSDELAAYIYAKIQLSKEGGNTTEARKVLKGLVYGGRFFNLESLITLYRVSDSPEQRNDSIETAKALLTARPELKDSVETQLSSLGILLSNDISN